MTLHHLLTHTSGIINYRESLAFRPSTKYSYSNPGYILIGFAIQEISKAPLDIYFKQILFDAAKLQDTYLPLRGRPSQLKEESRFHHLSLGFESSVESGQVFFTSVDADIRFEKLLAAGGIISTAQDLIKWNHALYSAQIIPPFLMEKMITKHTQKEAYPFYDGVETLWYGYGLDIFECKGHRFFQHCGGLPGYQSRFSYNFDTNITIVSLSDTAEERAPIYSFVNLLRDLL